MATAKSQPKHAQPDFAFEVKSFLLLKRWSITQLANHLCFARNTVSMAIHHPDVMPTVTAKVRQWVADTKQEMGVVA